VCALLCIAAAPSVHAMRQEHCPQRHFLVPLAEAKLCSSLFAASLPGSGCKACGHGSGAIHPCDYPPSPPYLCRHAGAVCEKMCAVRLCAHARVHTGLVYVSCNVRWAKASEGVEALLSLD